MAHMSVLGIDIAKQIWLLAIFGETGLFGGLATCSCPREGKENRAVTEGKSLHFPRWGSCALHFTKYDTDGEV